MPPWQILVRGARIFVGAALVGLTSLVGVSSSFAANILWVSDTGPLGFSGPGSSNLTDYGFVTLLQAAGHNVNRFNGPDAGATIRQLVHTCKLVVWVASRSPRPLPLA